MVRCWWTRSSGVAGELRKRVEGAMDTPARAPAYREAHFFDLEDKNNIYSTARAEDFVD